MRHKNDRNKIRERESLDRRTDQSKRQKRQTRKDKRQWINNILVQTENAANMQTMKTLYNITKMLSNEKPKRSAGIFDEKKKTYHKLYITARKMETAPL